MARFNGSSASAVHRPMVRQLLVQHIELGLANADDLHRLAVRGKEVLNLREASQTHRVCRHQLVAALVDKEAQRQIPVRELKVGHVQRTVRVME